MESRWYCRVGSGAMPGYKSAQREVRLKKENLRDQIVIHIVYMYIPYIPKIMLIYNPLPVALILCHYKASRHNEPVQPALHTV